MIFCHLLLLLLLFFSILTFSRNSSVNSSKVSNSLDPDQARQDIGPDLGLNCLPRLSADDTGKG